MVTNESVDTGNRDDAQRWERVNALFHAALARQARERATFLAAQCGQDGALRTEVESLLSAHEAGADTASGQVRVGTRVGVYEATGFLAAGAMGEVYRARDTKLGRDVALKILPAAFVADSDRRARFEREARLLASLNHPHIATIYGLEEADGVHALALELVDGETLAERIGRDRLPLEEALRIAKQVAEALEAAHEHGIIHRDLKPANIKLTRDGVVKVLDFGLAKALEPGSGTHVDATASPTITSPAMTTGVGVLLGTAAYMSPEQARGEAADRRSDVWAFGCVLYEMLTGRRPFAGDDISDTLANVLKTEPDWNRFPGEVPQRVRGVLRACLQKNPKERLGDVQSVRLALQGLFDTETSQDTRVVAQPMWRRVLPWVAGIAGIAVGGLFVGLASRVVTPSMRPMARFVVTTPDTPPFSPSPVYGTQNLAISPDGTRVIYRASAGGRNHLYVRRVDQLEGATLFSADEDVGNPIVSPDGAWVAFASATDRTWKKVSMLGGPAVTLFPASIPTSGASWGADDTIIFTANNGRLFRAPAAGGQSTALTTLDTRGETSHRRPEVLPGGAAVLFSICRCVGGVGQSEIAVLNLSTNEQRILLSGGSRPRYAPTGHLVYGAAGGTLMAVPFDLGRLQLAGDPVPVLEGVMTDDGGAVEFDLSANGSLVYVTAAGSGTRRSLVWVDREGRETALNVPRRAYTSPRISPDGTKLALNLRDEQNDIWIWDFVREMLTRLTFDPGQDRFPVWSPDGRRIAFSSHRDGSPGNPFWQAADGTGTAERLAESDGRQVFPTGFTPDATRLVVYGDHLDNPNNDDVGIVHLGDRRAVPLLEAPFRERNPDLSPDGRWLAYESNESGRDEVYVRPFPDVDKGRWQVSTGGGNQPRWARNGRELFFRRGTALMAVPVQTDPGFAAGNPAVVFEGSYAAPQGGRTYDVSPDGRRFLMIKEGAATGDAAPRPQIVLVQNWTEELKRLVPTR